VLTVRKIGSLQAGDYSGYLTGRADTEREAWQAQRGDYYTGPAEGATDAAGLWRGDASALAALGVEQDTVVGRDALARALRGQRADTGEQLRRPGANGVVNSHDLTMGVPKSVSVLWAQSTSERRAAIEQVTREAAEQTVRYMALTTACVQRRTETGERVWEPARGVVAAYFVHHTARRASSADVPDPHLHVHCVVVGVERSDGKLVTPNQAAWVRHGREGGAYFRSELASRLVELGLSIEHGTGKQRRYFEVEGVPREARERLSGRTREVEAARAEFVARYGRLPVDGELADLAIKSRQRKGPETVAEIEPYWRAVAAEHGFDAAAASRVWQHSMQLDAAKAHEQVAHELVERVAAQGATVRTRELRATAYELGAGRLTPVEAMRVVADMQERGLLIALADDRVTTRSIRETERYVLDVAQRAPSATAGSRVAVGAGIVGAQAAIGAHLTHEQVLAVDALCGDARVAALTGRAGTGKGAVIRAASEAYQADGWRVIAVATQGATAQRLGGQANTLSLTINQLAARYEMGYIEIDRRTVVLVDEAGMVDTHRLASLMRIVEQTGCKLGLVGDTEQLSAIGAGGLLPRLLDLDAVRVCELHEIHRTPHQWVKDVQNLLRDGKASEALGLLHEHGAAHMLDTHREAMQRMVDDWNVWRHEHAIGDTLLVVHSTNVDVDAVNMLAQAKRREAGELGERGVKSPDRDYLLHAGDQVMFRQQAYRNAGERRVENGTSGVIERVSQEHNKAWVRVNEPRREPRVVEVDLDRCQGLRLDYASHVYPAQGDTRMRTAELTGGPTLSRESAYVGGTRLRERHDLYTSREALGSDGTDGERWQRLAEQMNESRTQRPSLDYREQPGRSIAVEVPAPQHDASGARLVELERELAHAAALRDELRRSFPARLENELAQVRGDYKRARDAFDGAEQRIAMAQRDLDGARAWQREQLRDARERIARFTQQRDQYAREANHLVEQYTELANRPDAPKAWKREHGAELAAREQRVDDLTRQRDELRARSIEERVRRPQRYLTRVIGDRPADQYHAQAWERAARSIETYRHEYQVRDQHTALGREPDDRRDYQQWLAFDRTCGDVTRARDQLGRSNREHTFAPDRVPNLAHMRPGHGRGISRER
jgi:conjugative relaxase-like TrwC/TraI family protein